MYYSRSEESNGRALAAVVARVRPFPNLASKTQVARCKAPGSVVRLETNGRPKFTTSQRAEGYMRVCERRVLCCSLDHTLLCTVCTGERFVWRENAVTVHSFYVALLATHTTNENNNDSA